LKLNKIAIAMLLCSPAFAESECEYIDNTVVNTTGTIEQTRNYSYETANFAEEKRVCAVKLDVKIGKNWVKTQDFYVFGPEISQNEACSKAKDKAKIKELEKHVPQTVTNNSSHKCKEVVKTKPEPPKVIVKTETVYVDSRSGSVVKRNDDYDSVTHSIGCGLLSIFHPGPYNNRRCHAFR